MPVAPHICTILPRIYGLRTYYPVTFTYVCGFAVCAWFAFLVCVLVLPPTSLFCIIIILFGFAFCYPVLVPILRLLRLHSQFNGYVYLRLTQDTFCRFARYGLRIRLFAGCPTLILRYVTFFCILPHCSGYVGFTIVCHTLLPVPHRLILLRTLPTPLLLTLLTQLPTFPGVRIAVFCYGLRHWFAVTHYANIRFTLRCR